MVIDLVFFYTEARDREKDLHLEKSNRVRQRFTEF